MNPSPISKAAILHASIIKQQLTLDDFEKEIQSLQHELTTHEESASQEHQGSAEKNELLVRLDHEVGFLKKELMDLETIDPQKICNHVEPGAVVVTDQRIFFISTSVEQLEINGQSVFGISVKAPIYPSMKDKKAGDFFQYGGVNYHILEVY